MPLQIRRGTDTERLAMTVPLAAGELLWVTDEQKLYVGNGTTVAGNLSSITGYTDENAQDAAAALFQNGTHSGITFSYTDSNDRINATVNLSAYNGPIKGDLTGSVFADDSTRLIDATNGKFNLSGTIGGNIVPDTNVAYDIGTNLLRFKDLYLSGSSIYLGDAVIRSTGTALDLPLGTTIGGLPLGSDGSDYVGNIIGDDSSVIVNTSNNSVIATGGFYGNLFGDVEGSVIGDVKGSVFGQDSTVIVNAIDNKLNAQSITLNAIEISSNTSGLFFGNIEDEANYSFYGGALNLIHAGNDSSDLSLSSSKGTLTSPTVHAADDTIGSVTFRTWGGSDYVRGVTVSAEIDSAVTGTELNPTRAIISANAQNTGDFAFLAINSWGLFSGPKATQIYPQTSAQRTTIAGSTVLGTTAGMLVFNSDLGSLEVNTGSTWNQIPMYVASAPATSKGASGDKKGMVFASSGYVYVCYADYTDGLSDIWARTATTGATW